ncbi:hypothetical protein [Neorhizobium sp. JUb45]|uniref:hypothetical protein n=1 Tax=Neorhizobium sp. JUb45 TaxID=2485113 RepID=UPI001048813B|nr:hypothetical protein [Neorhizobium sp. JUb45]TCR04253.1 hypothetical protein EDF70_102351 [Neorhizobium sp. JUb45]
MTERFILKFLSPETGCSAHELCFEAAPSVIANIMGMTVDEVMGYAHYPDDRELTAISAAIGVSLPRWPHDVELTRPHLIDTAPYLVHTNFELPLMLDGRKPFAVVSGEDDFHPLINLRACFSPYVERGEIIARIAEMQAGGRTFIRIYYALPGEDWRFDAYDVLMNGPRPWTADMEWQLGSILGYSDEQNEWWIANGFKPAPPKPSA